MQVKCEMVITDEDYKLLKGYIPDDPCKKCYNSSVCCGCPRGEKYKEDTQPLKDNGLLEAAKKVKFIRDTELEIKNLEIQIRNTKNELGRLGFDLDKLFEEKASKPMSIFTTE